MRLVFENSSPKNERRLRAAFDVATAVLGIQDQPYTVVVVFSHEPPVYHHIAPGVLAMRYEGGGVRNTIAPGNVLYMKLNLAEVPAPPPGATRQNLGRGSAVPNDLLETFCHEMVHVAQMVTGRLRREREGCYFNKRLYATPRTHQEYQDLPWEQEADELGARITQIVNQQLKFAQAA